MQFWPRKKALREHARVRNWSTGKGLLGFAGYKVGMTHLMIQDNRPTSKTKGEEIFCPATIIECPPLMIGSARFYKKNLYGLQPLSQIVAQNLSKELARKICIPKKQNKKIEDIRDFDRASLVVYTQPKLTGIGKKKPELFEIDLGGNKEEQLNYAKELLGKEIHLKDIFKEGEQLDVHAITKGKGFQGPVKRFGVSIRQHKSEKTKRGAGSLGGWRGQGHVMYRVAHAGQMGYHQRTEYNKLLLKIGKDPLEIEQNGGFVNYGIVKNPYIILKGSVPGPKKRLIKFSRAVRADKIIPKEAPVISYISKVAKQ